MFFYVGGVVSAVLLSRRMFLFPAFGPLLYNAAIILGGVLFVSSFWHRFSGLWRVGRQLSGTFLIMPLERRGLEQVTAFPSIFVIRRFGSG